MRYLDVIRSRAVSPARDLAIQRHLLGQMEKTQAPVLHLGWISGDAVVLGRYQRRHSAVSPEWSERGGAVTLRRPSGGRAVWCAPGQLSVSLVMSQISSLLPPGSAAVGPDKIINRYVRGVLGGLQARGFKAYYFGRDFLSVDRKHAGYVSFEVAPSGATLFHALVAVSRSTTLPEGVDGYPGIGGNRPDPAPTTLQAESRAELDPEALESAIVDGYARNQQTEPRERTFSPLEATLLGDREAHGVADSEDGFEPTRRGWGHSDLKPIACGWLEAAAQVVQERFLGAARLFGDFMAPSGAIDALERELRLVPLDWRELGLVVDRTLGEGGNLLAGVRYLRVIPDAILDAVANVDAQKESAAPLAPTDRC